MSTPPHTPTSPTPTEPTASFADFGLAPSLERAVAELGFDAPTPIQVDAIPVLLAGRDVIAGARTGSGKTAAFGLPLLQRVGDAAPGAVRALVLEPTRELALQVSDALRSYAAGSPVRVATVYGGVAYGPQLRDLRDGTPVIVGTPGRLLDHLDRGALDLSHVELVVIDEADEMLRMGFIDDVTRLLDATPPARQVALFSATMPEPIRRVAQTYLRTPVEVQVETTRLSVGHIAQRGMIVPERFKLEALQRVLVAEEIDAALVFARTRASCAELAERLGADGVRIDALHGDMTQTARERVLNALRERRLDVVVATDVAARGIDVSHISHVINLDVPGDTETYVHRIGRTGRAGREGVAITFVTPLESSRLRYLERELRVVIEPMAVPTDADIARRRERILERELAEAAERVLVDGVEAYLDRLLEAGGISERELALAALTLLGSERGVRLGAPVDERPPHWARLRSAHPEASPARRPRPAPDHGPAPRADRLRREQVDADAVALFLPIGRDQGVRAADIVWGLSNAAGVPGKFIGRITIQGRKSFVALPADLAKRVLATTRTLPIRGRDIPVSEARLSNKT
jgi:ATP-dependent RNA helicase DeaD